MVDYKDRHWHVCRKCRHAFNHHNKNARSDKAHGCPRCGVWTFLHLCRGQADTFEIIPEPGERLIPIRTSHAKLMWKLGYQIMLSLMDDLKMCFLPDYVTNGMHDLWICKPANTGIKQRRTSQKFRNTRAAQHARLLANALE